MSKEEDGIEVKVRAWVVDCSLCWCLSRPFGGADGTAIRDGVRHIMRRGDDLTFCGLEMAP